MSIFKTTATVTICNLENICFNSSFIPIAIIAIGTKVEPRFCEVYIINFGTSKFLQIL